MKDVSIWLIPKKEQEEELRKTIDILSQKYGAYSFIPHLTIYHLGTSLEEDKTIQIVSEETINVKPFTLEAETIKHSDIFTKTLYVPYQVAKPLLNMYERLRNRFQSIHNYALNPHLSLIYKNNMRVEDKEKEIGNIKYPQTLDIDRVMVITKEGSTITQEKDVLDWKIAFEKAF